MKEEAASTPITIGQPGSWKRVRWFAADIGGALVILFAVIGFAQFVWEIVQHVR